MLRIKNGLFPTVLVLLFGVWIFYFKEIYFDPKFYLPADNVRANFPVFRWISSYLILFKEIPDWFWSQYGGVWVAPLTNLLLIVQPHRLLGHLGALLSGGHFNLWYKTSFLIVGQGLYLTGIYILFRDLLNQRLLAVGAVILFFLSSSILSFLHQEQAFAVVSLLPLLWFCLKRISKDSRAFIALCSVWGYSLNLYYPQLVFCYSVCFVISGLVDWEDSNDFIKATYKSLRRKPLHVLIGLAALLMTASPLLYSFTTYGDRVASPVRSRTGSLEAKSYEELVSMQSKLCNFFPENIKHYLGIKGYELKLAEEHDKNSYYVGPFILLCFFFLLLVRPKHWKFHLSLLILLFGFAVGFYGFVPKLIWSWFPGMKMFRQYLHFSHFINLHLFCLCFLLLKESVKIKRGHLLGAALFLVAYFSGLLNPEVAAGSAATLLILKTLKQKTSLAAGLIFLWIFATNLQWAIHTVSGYEKEGYEKTFSEAPSTALQLISDATPFEAPPPTLSPRDFDFKKTLAVWIPPAVEANAGGGKLRLLPLQVQPPGSSLNLQQFNDGRWRTSSNVQLASFGDQVRIQGATVGEAFTLYRDRDSYRWFLSLALLICILSLSWLKMK